MSIFIICIFGVAALLGAFLLTYVLMNKETPKSVAILHGFVASIGIISLIYYSFYYPIVIASLVLFVLAALGGIYLLITDISGKQIPKLVALAHGATAVVAFTLLVIFLNT